MTLTSLEAMLIAKNMWNSSYGYTSNYRMPEIKNVIFNDPATIVFWVDGTKTVVKCQEGDIYDPEKGMAMAIAKKALGNQGNYCNVFNKWVPEENIEALTIDDALTAIREFGRHFNLSELDLRLKKERENEITD